MVCKIYRHPQLAAIDEAVLDGASLRDIAKQFKTSRASVHRHQKHLSETLRKAHEASEVGRADSLVDQLKELYKDAQNIKDKTEKRKDYRGALAAIRQLERLLQVALKVSDQFARENRNSNGNLSEAHLKLYRHAARVMCGLYHADDSVVLVITENQAAELAEKLAQIHGISTSPDAALRRANSGLALIDDVQDFYTKKEDSSKDPPVGYRF